MRCDISMTLLRAWDRSLGVEILIIEDDQRLSSHLTKNLAAQGFNARLAENKEQFENELKGTTFFEVILLDRLIGNIDAKAWLPKIRAKWPQIPILVLSAISTPNERSDLINMGADDYLGKPFSTSELVARLKSLIRRTASGSSDYLQVGELILDSVARTISYGETRQTLPAKEFLLLRILCREVGRVWSKRDLLDYVWGQQNLEVETNVVEATITNLRKRLFELGTQVEIKNTRSVGYWLEA